MKHLNSLLLLLAVLAAMLAPQSAFAERVSQYPTAVPFTGAEMIPCIRGTSNYKCVLDDVVDYLGDSFQVADPALQAIIDSTYAGDNSIVTVGTIGTGTWQGSAIADAYIAGAATWSAKQAGDADLTQYALLPPEGYPTTMATGNSAATNLTNYTADLTAATAANRRIAVPDGTYSVGGTYPIPTNSYAVARRKQFPLEAPLIRFIGDSEVSQADTGSHYAQSGSTSTSMTRYARFTTFFSWMNGGAFGYYSTLDPADYKRKGSNSANGGDDLDDLLAKLPAVLAVMPEDYLGLLIGTNDINAGTSLATLKTKMTSAVDMITAAGKKPILFTVLPRNAVDGAFDWGSTGTTQAQKRLILAAYNTWLARFAMERGILCVTWHHVFTDSTGQAIAGYTDDGLHPSGKGSWALAREYNRQIGHLHPRSVKRAISAYDTYDATYNPQGNPLNGLFTGTGGATSDAGGTGAITGTVPDNWRLNKGTSTTTSVSAAIVARTDGTPGNILELTFTSLGTGNVSENWRLEYWTGSTTSLASYANKDDALVFSVEAEARNGHGGVFKNVLTRITGNNVANTNKTTVSFDATAKTITDSGGGFSSFTGNRMVVVTGAANSANNGEKKVVSATSTTLTLDPSETLVTESAGNSVTVTLPYVTVVGGGASNTRFPDEPTGILTIDSPVGIQSVTGNITPRLDIYIDGTIAGTAVVRIAAPKLMKLPFTPSVLSFVGDDH